MPYLGQHPGQGPIGLKAFSRLLNDPRFYDHPFLLETPKGMDLRGKNQDMVNLNRLKKLIKVVSQ